MMHREFQIVDRDDPYLKYANGVVYDSKTGLEWSAEHPDSLSSRRFDFSRGNRDWHSRAPKAYAVRVRK